METTFSSAIFKYKASGYNIKEVRVVGSFAELGNWDPQEGISLAFHHPDYWLSDLVYLSGVNPLEYKYYFKLDTGGDQWEPMSYNRKFVLREGLINIEDEINSYVSKITISPDTLKSCPVLPYKFPEFPGKVQKKQVLLASQSLPIEVVKDDSLYMKKYKNRDQLADNTIVHRNKIQGLINYDHLMHDF